MQNGGEIVNNTIKNIGKIKALNGKLSPKLLDPARKVFVNTLVIRSKDLENGEAFGHIPTTMLIDILSFNSFLYYYRDCSILSDGVYDRLFRHLKLRYKKGLIPRHKYYYLPENLFEQDHCSFTKVEDPFIVELAEIYYNNQSQFGKRKRK